MSSQGYGFSSGHVWMWQLDYKESWAPKNWWFELWCWRRLLRVPWTARRSNQSVLKEISPGCSFVGLMLKLKLQYLGHLVWRADSFEKTLMLCREQRSWGRRLGIHKGGIEPQESPWKFSSIYPQNQSLPTFCFVFSPTLLTLRGAVPHYLSLKKKLAYSSS